MTAIRVSAGLNGDISDSLSWDVAATYMEQNATREGRDTVVNRYQLALRGLGGPNCNIAANTPGANGCFWFNPFNNAIPAQSRSPAQTNSQFNAALSNDNPRADQLDVPGRLDRAADHRSWWSMRSLNGTTGIDLPGGALGLGGRARSTAKTRSRRRTAT